MKATRAYIASLGTTGALLASSVLLLVVVSTLVAFRGWPGGGVIDGLKGLVVDQGSKSVRVSGPAQVAINAAPAAAAVAGAPAGGPAAGGVAGRSGGAPGPQAVSPQPGGVSQPRPAAPTPGAPGLGSPQLPTPPGGMPDVSVPPVDSGNPGNTTENTTQQLGQTVGGVSPQVGQGVTDTGKALSEIVRGLPAPPKSP